MNIFLHIWLVGMRCSGSPNTSEVYAIKESGLKLLHWHDQHANEWKKKNTCNGLLKPI